jgi:hypothetical protein
VAEDQPLKITLRPRDAPRLNPSGEPLPQMASEVAAAYDYDVVRHGSVFLLEKRYTDPADLPDVTLTECAKSLEELQEVTSAVKPHLNFAQFGDDKGVADLLTSLTPEQLEMMRNKSESVPRIDGTVATDDEIRAYAKQSYDLAVQSQGLPISTLTPEQREVLKQIILVVGVTLPTLSLNPKTISDAAKQDPEFCRGRDHYGPAFGYELPTGTGKQKAFTSLISWSGNPKNTINGVRFPLPPDPSAPTFPLKAGPPIVSISLAQALSSLDARAGSQPKMLVAEELAPKRVSLFGADTAAPAALFQALADVYGLAVHTRKDGSRVLVPQDVQIPLDYAAMAANVHKAVPDPLRRAELSNRARQRQGPVSYEAGQGGSYSGIFAPVTLETSALKILRTAVEPRIKTAGDGHVPLSSLGEREKSALAVLLTAPQLESLVNPSGGKVPDIITRFDELCMVGGPEAENKNKFDLVLALPVAGGTAPPWQVLSASGIDYMPNPAVAGARTP